MSESYYSRMRIQTDAEDTTCTNEADNGAIETSSFISES